MLDRLVDLINEAKDEYPTIPSVNCCKPTFAYYLANRLLADGAIVPPCKVGDTVYVIGRTYTECHLGTTPNLDSCDGCEDECDSRKSLVVQEKKVKSLSYDGSHFGALVDDGSTIYRKFGTSNRYSAFITKEEAEQALAERKVL